MSAEVINSEELAALHKELQKALHPTHSPTHSLTHSTDQDRVQDVLRRLVSAHSLTAEQLQSSRIGLTMKSLRATFPNNVFVAQTCKQLVRGWRQLYREHVTATTTATTTATRKSATVSTRDGGSKGTKKEQTSSNCSSRVDSQREHCMRSNTYTITFGDQAENHVGMQKIGSLSTEGFDFDDLLRAQEWFEDRGVQCEMISLHTELLPLDSTVDEAYVLVARNGLSAIGGGDEAFHHAVFQEQMALNPDTKAFMYGRVVNKHARYNLCFGNFDQEPDYENGKGTVVSFQNVPSLQKVRDILPDVIGPKAENLEAEGNYYYDLKKCGIGFHGDSERMKVVALRLGASMQLCYAWFQLSKPISQKKVITLHHGDMYFMSQKATGQDWKRKLIPTLRHSAGAAKFTQLPS